MPIPEETKVTELSAFYVWIADFSEPCIVFAETSAKARWQAVRGYWDAYEENTWPRPSSTAAHRYAMSPLRFKRPAAYSEDYVQSTMP